MKLWFISLQPMLEETISQCWSLERKKIEIETKPSVFNDEAVSEVFKATD